MTDFITNLESISPEWLSAVLKKKPITHVEVETRELNTAHAGRLHVRYANASESERFFFKIGRRYSEVSFYQYIAPQSPELPLVHCYHARFADELGQSNLLFDDITKTHHDLSVPLPPSQETINQLMSILGNFHRVWWEDTRLKSDPIARQIDDLPAFVLSQVIPQFGHFVDILGDGLSLERRQLYERILAALPLKAQQERIQQQQQVTIVHGDAHFYNFAYPNDPAQAIYIQDWALWHVNIPTYDLAYMFSRCFPEFRKRVEQSALLTYHQHLSPIAYSWEQLWSDYRMAMVYHTIWPIFFHQFASTERWYTLFECGMSAFEELECEEFI
ncbi:MAG: phosphotransferase [Anaerolineae bacterium]